MRHDTLALSPKILLEMLMCMFNSYPRGDLCRVCLTPLKLNVPKHANSNRFSGFLRARFFFREKVLSKNLWCVCVCVAFAGRCVIKQFYQKKTWNRQNGAGWKMMFQTSIEPRKKTTHTESYFHYTGCLKGSL